MQFTESESSCKFSGTRNCKPCNLKMFIIQYALQNIDKAILVKQETRKCVKVMAIQKGVKQLLLPIALKAPQFSANTCNDVRLEAEQFPLYLLPGPINFCHCKWWKGWNRCDKKQKCEKPAKPSPLHTVLRDLFWNICHCKTVKSLLGSLSPAN